MKVITKGGIVLPVDESNIPDDDGFYTPMIQQVTLITDEVYLKKKWIATAEKNINAFNSRSDELEFVAEKIFDHEPNEQELMYFMAENGLNRYDYCHVKMAYQFDCEWSD